LPPTNFCNSNPEVPEFTPIVVPTNNVPPIPTPPVTTKAPVLEDVDTVLDVIDIPETLNISVDGLNDMVESLETADPEDDDDGVNNIEWKTFAVPALFTTIFCAVFPDELLEAVIGTQLITPAEVDCKTDDPVAGEVAGNVYIVLPVADETNAV
jgi:hypothetical protein